MCAREKLKTCAHAFVVPIGEFISPINTFGAKRPPPNVVRYRPGVRSTVRTKFTRSNFLDQSATESHRARTIKVFGHAQAAHQCCCLCVPKTLIQNRHYTYLIYSGGLHSVENGLKSPLDCAKKKSRFFLVGFFFSLYLCTCIVIQHSINIYFF